MLAVDDASRDRTAELVAARLGVWLVRTEHNVGFIGACNLGASHTHGAYLLLLNHVLVAADARGSADQVVALPDDDAPWRTLAATGASAITERFSPDVARAALQDLLATAAKGRA